MNPRCVSTLLAFLKNGLVEVIFFRVESALAIKGRVKVARVKAARVAKARRLLLLPLRLPQP